MNLLSRNIKQVVLLLFIPCFFTCIVPPTTLHAREVASVDFKPVAKKAKESVVSIKAQMNAKNAAARGGDGDEMGDIQEEFFRRFFGMPFQQKPEQRPPAFAFGSGFITTADGYILTNNHVISESENVAVILNDGREFNAKVIGTDPNTDIALLKIEAKDLPYLKFGDSDKLEMGDWVSAMGNPLGLEATFTVGVVSAKGRNDLGITNVEEFIQTDAAINRGNSGGPLLNLDGEVIGMNTAIASNTGGYMGIGFASPSNLIKPIVEQLLKNGKVVRGFLGVGLQNVNADLASAFGLKKSEGALVSDVIKDGPADKAGIKPGDVIISLNGQIVKNIGALRNSISFMQPGATAVLAVRRDDKDMVITAVIGTNPENEITAQEVQNNIGLLVQELTPDLVQQLGYVDEKGVVIKAVAPNSMAQFAGLRRGQLIVSVNRKPIKTPDEFYAILRERKSGSQMLLQVKEGHVTRFITLRVP